MEQTIEEILLADPHIVRIDPAEKWDIPELNYSLLFPASEKTARKQIGNIKDYLNMFYIVDDFSDHDQRTEWKEGFEQRYGNPSGTFLNNNCLRGNQIYFVRSSLRSLLDFCSEKFTENTVHQIMDTKDYIQSVDEKYDSLTTEEKIMEVKGIKEKLYGLLCYFSGLRQEDLKL